MARLGRPPLAAEERAARTRAILDAELAIAIDRYAAIDEEWPYAQTKTAALELVQAYPHTISDAAIAKRLDWTVRQVKAARRADPFAFATDEARRFRPPAGAFEVMAAIADELGWSGSRIAIYLGIDPRRLRAHRHGPIYDRARALIDESAH